MTKIYAVIITYNGMQWIEKCINSVFSSAVPTNVIIIDNNSDDGTPEFLKSNYNNKIHLIECDKNLGFSKANNIGIRYALDKNADYIFLLNQDAWIEDNAILELINLANDNDEYGVISPVHLNGTYTALDLNFSKQLAPELCPSFYSDLYMGKLKSLYEIEFVNAAAWLLKMDCIKKVGLFEELFFIYGEDNNYLQRVKYHGFKVGVTPKCTICHDREMRRGDLNETGKKLWQRTQSLIELLNIQKSYTKCIILFLKQSFKLIAYKIYYARFREIKYNLSDLFFLMKNFKKIKSRRNFHKVPNNFYSLHPYPTRDKIHWQPDCSD